MGITSHSEIMRTNVKLDFWERFKRANQTASSPYYGLFASVLGLSAAMRLVSIHQQNSDLAEENQSLRDFQTRILSIHEDILKDKERESDNVNILLKELAKHSQKEAAKKFAHNIDERRSRLSSLKESNAETAKAPSSSPPTSGQYML